MLATRQNVHFEGPVGELKNRYIGTFYYRKDGKEQKCEVEMLDMGGDVEKMYEDIVVALNELLCKTYPYPEITEIEAIYKAPVNDFIGGGLAQVQAQKGKYKDDGFTVAESPEQALAKTILDAANRLSDPQDYTETWPQVVQRCIEKFNNYATTLDVIIDFFRDVVEKFSRRAYDTGWAQGHKRGLESGRAAFLQKLEARMHVISNEIDDGPIKKYEIAAKREEIQALLDWTKI